MKKFIKSSIIVYVLCFVGLQIYAYFQGINIQDTKWLFGCAIAAFFMSIAYFSYWYSRHPDSPLVKRLDNWMAKKTKKKEPEVEPLSAMTVNERLFTTGLTDKFDKEARKQNVRGMIKLLKKVEMSQKEAEKTAYAIVNDPPKYGY